MEFTHYYGKHKHHNKTVGQQTVGHSVKKSVRFWFENYKQLSCEPDFSKKVNEIIKQHFQEKKEKSWQQEVAEW